MPVPNYLLAQGNGTDNHSGEQPGWLGVEFMNRPDGHLIITKIAPGGPADDNQGILVGDVLQAINDTVVRKLSPDEMRKLIKGMFEVKE
jgi:C-terminal processing protease CtpA/Prc